MDVINLLEFGQEYLTPRQKKRAINNYLKAREGFTGKGKIRYANPSALRTFSRTVEQFHSAYNIVGVHRHLELIGYKIRDAAQTKGVAHEQNLASQRYHFEKAIEHLAQTRYANTLLKDALLPLTDVLPSNKPVHNALAVPSDYFSLKTAVGFGVGLVGLTFLSALGIFAKSTQDDQCWSLYD